MWAKKKQNKITECIFLQFAGPESNITFTEVNEKNANDTKQNRAKMDGSSEQNETQNMWKLKIIQSWQLALICLANRKICIPCQWDEALATSSSLTTHTLTLNHFLGPEKINRPQYHSIHSVRVEISLWSVQSWFFSLQKYEQ